MTSCDSPAAVPPVEAEGCPILLDIRHVGREVSCNAAPDMAVAMRFPSQRALYDYMSQYCTKTPGHRYCPLYQTLYSRFGTAEA